MTRYQLENIKTCSTNYNMNINFNQRKNVVKKCFYRKIKMKTLNSLVVNLSHLNLSNADISVLNKGLKYVPTPSAVNTCQPVKNAFANLRNRMATRYFFINKPHPRNELHRKSNWLAPEPQHKNLQNFFALVKRDLCDFTTKFPLLRCQSNLTRSERKSLLKLSKNRNIVIKKADKGGRVVIMSKDDYIGKVYDHLSNNKYYAKMKTDPSKDLKTNINSFIEISLCRHNINKNTAKFITPPENTKMPLFYILPKIHKDGIPGRPIVSAVNSITENISEFLNLCLQPLLPKLKSYVKDTKHLIQRLQTIPAQNEHVLLVSADVSSLYTNIPHQEGVDACIHFIRKYRNTLPSFTPNEHVIRTLFSFILENNYFMFLNEIYLQLLGTAMDDIFFIWEHSEEELHKFFIYLNSIHPTIKFTYEYSTEEISFLDTTIYLDKRSRKLKTKLFIKPTDSRALLHFTSYHPHHTKRGIIYSQALRYRMITSQDSILKCELDELKSILLTRGYKGRLVDEIFGKIAKLKQSDVLSNSTHKFNKKRIHFRTADNSGDADRDQNKDKHILPFLLPYHEKFTTLKRILHKYWFIIESDPALRLVFQPNHS
ncbi:uncharacterized protein LOC130612918 [Hydractinia symbiolongicarpus]|uniref:uncharacterized protein LOC130612918 n=1 Tax=Hydractinia symbiolongicarpus TaxID=13093 RepID=UPI00254A06E8|nr:uncharacterized protein LOC130612918 [Hydractinia symbiolongicarpus]